MVIVTKVLTPGYGFVVVVLALFVVHLEPSFVNWEASSLTSVVVFKLPFIIAELAFAIIFVAS